MKLSSYQQNVVIMLNCYTRQHGRTFIQNRKLELDARQMHFGVGSEK